MHRIKIGPVLPRPTPPCVWGSKTPIRKIRETAENFEFRAHFDQNTIKIVCIDLPDAVKSVMISF